MALIQGVFRKNYNNAQGLKCAFIRLLLKSGSNGESSRSEEFEFALRSAEDYLPSQYQHAGNPIQLCTYSSTLQRY